MVQRYEVAVRHRRNVVDDDAIRLFGKIFVAFHRCAFRHEPIDMMAEHRRRLVPCKQVREQTLVHFREHLLNDVLELRDGTFLEVDLLVVLLLGFNDVLESLFAHGDAIAPVAVVDDVDRHVAYDLSVRAADVIRIEYRQRVDNANVYGIEAVLADIGNHIAYAHNATFERRWSELLYFLRVLGASFDVFVEHVERRAVAEIEHLLSEFPVVA